MLLKQEKAINLDLYQEKSIFYALQHEMFCCLRTKPYLCSAIKGKIEDNEGN